MQSYSFGYRKGRNRTISVSAETGHIARAAGELLLKSVRREARDRQVVKDLTDAAVRWQSQADAIDRPSDDLKKFYRDKAHACIDQAARIIAEGERA